MKFKFFEQFCIESKKNNKNKINNNNKLVHHANRQLLKLFTFRSIPRGIVAHFRNRIQHGDNQCKKFSNNRAISHVYDKTPQGSSILPNFPLFQSALVPL